MTATTAATDRRHPRAPACRVATWDMPRLKNERSRVAPTPLRSLPRAGISHSFLTDWPDGTGLWHLCRTPRAARLSASATWAALRVLAEHGLAERGPGGWRRGPAALADVAESTGAADLQREREERYRQDRQSWRARLRQYRGAGTIRPELNVKPPAAAQTAMPWRCCAG